MKKTVDCNIVLSKRMQAIADFVDEKRVADVGCDHAFVSIELALRDTTEKIIAMDVRRGPLDIAKKNIKAYGLDEVIETRLSDGLFALTPKEADCAVIAGMGGLLIVRILKQAKEHIQNGIHLVLQPQSDADLLREYLASIGYYIIRENMLMEEGKYYTVIKAVPCMTQTFAYTKEELLFGPLLLRDRHPVLKQYLEEQLMKQQALSLDLLHINTDKASLRVAELESEITYISKCLKEF